MEIKQRRDYIKLIEEMYDHMAVSIDNVFGVNYWPVIRIQTGYFLHLLFVGRTVSDTGKLPVSYKKANVFPVKELLQYCLTSLQLYGLKAALKGKLQKKVILVGFEKHKINLLNKKVNIYIEPFVDYFKELDIPVEILWIDRISGNPKSSLEYSFHLIKRNTRAKIALKRAISGKYEKEYEKAFKLALSTEQFLKNETPSYAGIIANIVYKNILENELVYHSAIQFLTVTQPAFILNYCYYNNNMLALQRASNKLNIPITEYQHSIQADEHLAYAPWKNVDSYASFFPSKFWVWSKDDAKRTEKNFGDHQFKPEVVIGGNVFLVQQKAQSVNEYSSAKAVLITLQGSWIPDFVENIIAERNDFVWYFRLHPRYPDDKSKLTALNEKYPDRVEMQLANELPLYSLFQKVQFNITSSSGTALEALSFNVTNLIFGQDGYNCFESYIKEDLFYFIEDAERLNYLLDNSIQNSEVKYMEADTDSILKDLKELYD